MHGEASNGCSSGRSPPILPRFLPGGLVESRRLVVHALAHPHEDDHLERLPHEGHRQDGEAEGRAVERRAADRTRMMTPRKIIWPMKTASALARTETGRPPRGFMMYSPAAKKTTAKATRTRAALPPPSLAHGPQQTRRQSGGDAGQEAPRSMAENGALGAGAGLCGGCASRWGLPDRGRRGASREGAYRSLPKPCGLPGVLVKGITSVRGLHRGSHTVSTTAAPASTATATIGSQPSTKTKDTDPRATRAAHR